MTATNGLTDSILLDFDASYDECTKRDLDVDKLLEPHALGAIRFNLMKKGDFEVIRRFDFVVGLEPPLEIPFSTTPGYSRPWYSLDVTHKHDPMPLKSTLLRWKDHESPRTLSPSLGRTVDAIPRVVFTLEDNFSRYFYPAQVVVESRGESTQGGEQHALFVPPWVAPRGILLDVARERLLSPQAAIISAINSRKTPA